MVNKVPGPTTIKASKSGNHRLNGVLFGIGCAFLMGVLTWATDSYSPLEAVLNPDPANSYYNLLVQGFQSGQLNLKINTPPEFAVLADPYDPRHNWSTGFWANKLDTSYYKGKFYLYFGVTPALALFWPCAEFTGHYLSDRCAVAIFFALGFLVLWWLLGDVRRRYFSETSMGFLASGILMVGPLLALTCYGSVNGVATIAGFAFVLPALAGIWLALHQPAHRNGWLLLASLAYGLATGSRPSLLFGAVILLAPVLQAWFEPPGAVPRRQIMTSFLSAIGPILFIGLGLMVYNDLRFDSPFEFGRRYQLTADYESTTARQWSPHYLWFNIRYYFLEPISVNAYFPFLQKGFPPHPPSGYSEYSGYGSILLNYPFILFIFAVPLIWRKPPMREISALSWFILALFLLFVACALTDCFFMAAQQFYILDFLPPLILLAFIGVLGWDKALVHWPNRRDLLRTGWYGLLGFSLVFNSLANVEARAFSDFNAGEHLLEQNQPDEALGYLQNAASLEPHQAVYHNQLAIAYSKTGRMVKALDESQKALDVDPNFTQVKYNIGSFLYQDGQSEEAFKYFENALNGDPKTNGLYAADNIASAWMLVFNPDPGKRNGPLAIKLAEAACQETRYQNAQALVVSAEVFGKTGRTNEMIWLAQKAVAAAKQNGESNLFDLANSLLTRYQKK